MKLTPLRTPRETRYPARAERARGGRSWLRRALAAASASGALALGGCYAATPMGSSEGTPPEPTEPSSIVGWERPGRFEPPEERLPGDVAIIHFLCSDAGPPEPINLVGVPGWFEGMLCGEQTAWAAFDVEGDGPDLRIGLDLGADRAVVAVIGPDGVEVEEIGGPRPSVEVGRAEGRFWLAATPTDPEAHGSDWISGYIELVEE